MRSATTATAGRSTSARRVTATATSSFSARAATLTAIYRSSARTALEMTVPTTTVPTTTVSTITVSTTTATVMMVMRTTRAIIRTIAGGAMITRTAAVTTGAAADGEGTAITVTTVNTATTATTKSPDGIATTAPGNFLRGRFASGAIHAPSMANAAHRNR